MAYATYFYYLTEYKGLNFNTPEEVEMFDTVAMRAGEYLNAYTMNRITDEIMNDKKTAKKVMFAECALCDLVLERIKLSNSTNSSLYSSVSSGSEKITYVNSDKTILNEKVFNKNVIEIIRMYLNGTGLNYNGIGGVTNVIYKNGYYL